MFTKVLYIHTIHAFELLKALQNYRSYLAKKKRRWKKSSDERRCRQRCRLSLTFSRSIILAATATRKKVRKLCSLPICFYSAVLCREISSTALNLINNIHMTTGIWKSAAVEGWNESFKFSCYCSSDMRFLKTLGMMLLWFLLHWPN